ncbi:hypothetical protein B0H14DRAFT_2557396 [Mycena olivaceomarginata]|nr:hypothetical protein B0H14DRAFT_2557396 [Mycena olivaceomarginata]
MGAYTRHKLNGLSDLESLTATSTLRILLLLLCWPLLLVDIVVLLLILRTVHTNVGRANLDYTLDFRRQDPGKLAALYKLVRCRVSIQFWAYGCFETRRDIPYVTRKRFPMDWPSPRWSNSTCATRGTMQSRRATFRIDKRASASAKKIPWEPASKTRGFVALPPSTTSTRAGASVPPNWLWHRQRVTSFRQTPGMVQRCGNFKFWF